jgi:hypothetical protein
MPRALLLVTFVGILTVRTGGEMGQEGQGLSGNDN